ncbi:MAG: hypothetical protein OES09_13110 [Gammaproteobacteria bacterium]|nr:hypothetical protein [Gammaproteobacteria bacterium]
MGSFKSFACRYCDYTEPSIPVGRSARGPKLVLFVCRHCKSIGSTWRQEASGRDPVCSYCYDHDLENIGSSAELKCPKCGESGILSDAEGGWE